MSSSRTRKSIRMWICR